MNPPNITSNVNLTGNPLEDVLITPLRLFEPFGVIVFAMVVVFVFGISYIRSGQLYSAIAFSITVFAFIMAFFMQNLIISLVLYVTALLSLAAALWLTFGRRETYG